MPLDDVQGREDVEGSFMIDWNFIYIVLLKVTHDETQAREALAYLMMEDL